MNDNMDIDMDVELIPLTLAQETSALRSLSLQTLKHGVLNAPALSLGLTKTKYHPKGVLAALVSAYVVDRWAALRQLDVFELGSFLPRDYLVPFVGNCDIAHLPASILVFHILVFECGDAVVDKLFLNTHSFRSFIPVALLAANGSELPPASNDNGDPSSSWPQPVGLDRIRQCCEDYVTATNIEVPPACVSCGRQRFCQVFTYPIPSYVYILPPGLEFLLLLELHDEDLRQKCLRVNPQFFHYGSPCLSSLLLCKEGIEEQYSAQYGHHIALTVCDECNTTLAKGLVPKFSYANSLFTGFLPTDLEDLTWVEEMACALYRTTAHVVRLYGSDSPTEPFVLRGSTCAHALDTPSLAKVLPRTPADVNDLISVAFLGPGPLHPDKLTEVFKVRKSKIISFLTFLRTNNPLYKDIDISEEHLSQYPEEEALPGLVESVIVNIDPHNRALFDVETAGFHDHPSVIASEAPESAPRLRPFLETFGVSDPESSLVSGHESLASALHNLMASNHELPDILMSRGSNPMSDYSNPDFFPGMFPTLFPFGTAGFEQANGTHISFRSQAEYFLDLAEPKFRRHRYFMFVALSIVQKRAAHLNTSFSVRKPIFDTLSTQLNALTPELLQSVSDHVRAQRPSADLSPQQKNALDVLKQVNTVAAKIPGSQASKLRDRSSMFAYSAPWGTAHLYLTMNSNPAHSPLFQVFCGDRLVDLSRQNPTMASAAQRALRLVEDPVAAADFFQFSMQMFFKHLLGFDLEKRQSTPAGGILGKVQAYYGCVECTERGCLHGHFLIWLVGGLNPSEVHSRMESDPDFQARFFSFFESIIKHDLPDVEFNKQPSYEPRAERPLMPSAADNWENYVLYETKACGEVLQRHGECKPVCWKYKDVSQIPAELRACRFLFPHEIVEESYYDEENKAVILRCRDGRVNYHNPYILVYCRHNHDIKCILSGRAARAAIFYITNYITKSDLQLHQMLSLLRSAVLDVERSAKYDGKALTPKDRAKKLMQRCLAQFTRQQQVHSQQAVRYIRNQGDSISSHPVVPMLSSFLMAHVKKNLALPDPVESPIPHVEDDSEDHTPDTDIPECEEPALPLVRDNDGLVRLQVSQVEDYIHRDSFLDEWSFYEFVCGVRKEKTTPKTVLIHAIDSNAPRRRGRPRTLARVQLCPPHPQSLTHHLVLFHCRTVSLLELPIVPRMIGSTVPRIGSSAYPLFALAHHKPFSIRSPLIGPGSSPEGTFESTDFAETAVTVMKNWESLHECEDERDRERIRKQQTLFKESQALTRSIHGVFEENERTEKVLRGRKADLLSLDEEQIVSRLRQSNWFKPQSETPPEGLAPVLQESKRLEEVRPSALNVKKWKKSIIEQDAEVDTQRSTQASILPSKASLLGPPPSTTTAEALEDAFKRRLNVRPVTSSTTADIPPLPVLDVIANLIIKWELQGKQQLAFLMMAQHFIGDMCPEVSPALWKEPLLMKLSGPGGTGKSRIAFALKELLQTFDQGESIAFLAPTGGAASVIDASTIHSGLGIAVKRKENKDGTEGAELYFTSPDKQRLMELRWRLKRWVMLDEFSMIPAELLAEIDAVLKLVMKNDLPFGGLHVILAGDFCQFRPVASTPLYSPIASSDGAQTNREMLCRLGRLAWKSIHNVVELKEQHRMKSDKDYADAVLRLRTKECLPADVDLFNSRVIGGGNNRIDLGNSDATRYTAIVNSNRVRMIINNLKSHSTTFAGPVVWCAARDMKVEGSGKARSLIALESQHREEILKADFTSEIANGAQPGIIPLAVGMRVNHRGRNISTNLKIHNGVQGIVVALYTSICSSGHTCCDGAVIYLPLSPVKLEGLPAGCIFVEPEHWTSPKYQPEGCSESFHILRSQMTWSPAFAVTAHYAQGKTMPGIVASLSKSGGSAAAYVAASRPTSREGLFLTNPVTLQDLNAQGLPPSLRFELNVLEAQDKNTLIRYGFAKGALVPVPDAEESRGIRGKMALFKAQKSRKSKIPPEEVTNLDRSPRKRRQVGEVNTNPAP